jgi:CheY-like chemotaxis protein
MPGIDGYKLAPRLRDVSIQAGTRIVLVSGYVPDKLRLALAGIDGHILKPVDFALIRQLLTPSA